MPRHHIAQVNIARMKALRDRRSWFEQFAGASPDESFLASFDWSVFRPCPAT